MSPSRLTSTATLLMAALAGCSDPGTAPSSLSALNKASTVLTLCSDVTTTQLLYSGHWVPAFLFEFNAFSYPGAYPGPLAGSQWLGPTPTASFDTPAGTYHFRTTFRLPKIEEGEFTG